MLNINELATDLKADTMGVNAPYPVEDRDYVRFVVQAIKKFFVDVNHPGDYNRALYTTIEDDTLVFEYDFDIVQEEYIFILAKMRLYKMIYDDVSGDGAMSYTTNALSVTGAKEGYKSVKETLDALEQERIRVFHKMMARDTNES